MNSHANETIQALPNRIDSLRWIIIGGFAALLAIGLLLLWRQPTLASVGGAGSMPVPTPSQGPRKRKASGVAASSATPVSATPARAASLSSAQLASAKPASSASATAVAEPVSGPAASAGSFESEVQNPGPPPSAGVARVGVENSLDNLKDKLFRLELRRQAGTINEEDYVRERARTEAILRELVRG